VTSKRESRIPGTTPAIMRWRGQSCGGAVNHAVARSIMRWRGQTCRGAVGVGVHCRDAVGLAYHPLARLGTLPPAVCLLSKSNDCAGLLATHGRVWMDASKAPNE
jgi:hypothetical protein